MPGRSRTVSLQSVADERFDVAICGGGLAGLTLARQLRRELPALRVLVAERSERPLPDAAHKVGESSVEMGSQYLERLGLREYLHEHHLLKFGLRFFPGGGRRSVEERPEIGPAQEPIVCSYQLDRGLLENDLRGMIEADGAVLVEGAKVGAVDLGEGEADHEVELQREGERCRVRARFVVDATGRAALLRKRMKLTRGTKYAANAGWFRIRGKLDITELAPGDARAWHDAEWAPHRWRSTNHFMGPGYWAWVIPLSTGNTSIGLVGHDGYVPFESVRNLEGAMAFLRENEPQLAEAVSGCEVMDYRCLRNYSYNVARGWSAERWALVGEAGAFSDPLYSPGTDFIAFANCFTEEMIRCDLAGGDRVSRARELSAVYRSLVSGTVDLYRQAAPVYGHGPSLLAKIYWDNFTYWSYPCQIFQQKLYKLTGKALMEVMPVGERFAGLSRRLQGLFAAWAELAPVEPEAGFHPMPGFPSVLIDAHLALQQRWTPEEAVAEMRRRLGEAEEIAGELVLRAIDSVGPDKAPELVERAQLSAWGLSIADERVAATEKIGLARRKALRPLARDVERTLGRAPHQLDEAQMRAILGSVVASPDADLGRAAAGASP